MRDEYIITAPERLDTIAEDLVAHYIQRWQTGKAILICLDKPTTVKMYDRIVDLWQQAIRDQRRSVRQAADEQAEVEAKALLDWLEETQIRVVVSEEQNEVNRFQEWGLNIELHRKRMKDEDLEEDFKNPHHPFRLTIVCAMWLTGFDV